MRQLTYVDPDAKSRRIDLTAGIVILAAYVLNYGAFEARRVRYWPLASRVMQRAAWSLDQLNRWLVSATRPGAA